MTKLAEKLAKVRAKKETLNEKANRKVEEMSKTATETAIETAKEVIVEEAKSFWDENSDILIPLAMAASFFLGRVTSGTKNTYDIRNTYYIYRR